MIDKLGPYIPAVITIQICCMTYRWIPQAIPTSHCSSPHNIFKCFSLFKRDFPKSLCRKRLVWEREVVLNAVDRSPSTSILRCCQWLQKNLEITPHIRFTEDAQLTRNVINNTRNSHIWADPNLHETIVVSHQHRFCRGGGAAYWIIILLDLMFLKNVLNSSSLFGRRIAALQGRYSSGISAWYVVPTRWGITTFYVPMLF